MGATREKTCSLCRELKPLTSFYKASRATDGLQARCKRCHAARVRFYRLRLKQLNSERELPSGYTKRCPRCQLTQPARDFHRNASTRDGLHWVCRTCNTKSDAYGRQVERRRRFRTYDITAEEVEDLLRRQRQCCAICGIGFTGTEFHIDHWHASGIVRGLLCRRCNTALGLLKDDPVRLRAAIRYLANPPREAVRKK